MNNYNTRNTLDTFIMDDFNKYPTIKQIKIIKEDPFLINWIDEPETIVQLAAIRTNINSVHSITRKYLDEEILIEVLDTKPELIKQLHIHHNKYSKEFLAKYILVIEDKTDDEFYKEVLKTKDKEDLLKQIETFESKDTF